LKRKKNYVTFIRKKRVKEVWQKVRKLCRKDRLEEDREIRAMNLKGGIMIETMKSEVTKE